MAATYDEVRNLVARDVNARDPLTPDPKTYTLTEPAGPPIWYEEVRREFGELMALPEGWDSYNCRRISSGAVGLAEQVLAEPMFAALPKPAIVPTSIGGVQAEWEIGTRSLEIEFVSSLDLEVLYCDDRLGQELERTMALDLTELKTFVRRLSM